jgi:Ca2+-binding RTX toxin-like protein
VTDNLGAVSTIVTTTVRIDNAPPVATITGPAAVLRRQSATFQASFFDPGLLDTHQVRWDFGDGTVIDFMPGDNPDALVASHTYFRKGLYHVTFTVRDGDGACSSASMDVDVQVGHVAMTTTAAGMSTLTVSGTDNSDRLSVRKSKSNGALEVMLNNVFQGLFQADRVIIFGSDGNDLIVVGDDVTQPVEVFGGPGNDVIYGGVGDATLHGGRGNDALYGGAGKNVLFGGPGNDRLEVFLSNNNPATLHGGCGNDLLLGGAGDDVLHGGEGNDNLDGRAGNNRLLGGQGKDLFAATASDKVFDAELRRK